MLLAHNLEADDTITLRYASDAGFTADVGTVPVTFRAGTLIEFFASVTRQYWRLEIDLASSGLTTEQREAGRLLLGDHYQMERNVALGWSGPQIVQDTTRSARTEGGQRYSDLGVGLRSLRAQFTGVQ